MKTTDDAPKHAAEQAIAAEEACEEGRESKSKESTEKGADV